MRTCRATLPNGHTCNQMLYRCGTCGHVGCRNDQCKNQGFQRGLTRCLKCGATSKISAAP